MAEVTDVDRCPAGSSFCCCCCCSLRQGFSMQLPWKLELQMAGCLLWGSWKSNPDSLEEQLVLLTAEPSLQFYPSPLTPLCVSITFIVHVCMHVYTLFIYGDQRTACKEEVFFTVWVLEFSQGHQVPLPAESSHLPVLLLLLVLMCTSLQSPVRTSVHSRYSVPICC